MSVPVIYANTQYIAGTHIFKTIPNGTNISLTTLANTPTCNVMTIVNANVGIGTTIPLQPLHVQGNIYSSGNIGIGTTIPLKQFHVQGDIYTTGNINAGNVGMFRNRIINGDMMIDQRNAGAAVTNATTYTLDRFVVGKNGTLTVNVQQVNTPAALTGFQKCLKFSVGTQQATLTASDAVLISQYIEGYNVSDLMWGTSSAQSVTVSFWIYASNTGTFSIAVRNATAARSYVTNFTITSANTWQYVTATIPGDTTGTWAVDNTLGIQVGLCFGTGSTYQTTAGAWQAGNYIGTSSTTNFFANSVGSAVYITGLQLEKGTMATPFEFRPYGVELQLCQRYYDVYNKLTGPMFYSTMTLVSGASIIYYRVPKRAAPTYTISTGTAVTASAQYGGQTFNYNNAYSVDSINSFQITIGSSYPYFSAVNLTVNAEL